MMIIVGITARRDQLLDFHSLPGDFSALHPS